MIPEKPKIKRKRDTSSNKRFAVVAILLVLAMGIGAGVVLLPRLFPMTFSLSDVTAVQIQDSWAGLVRWNPLEASYLLSVDDEGWAGDVTFSLAQGEVTESATITIPQDIVDEFIALIETTPLVAGEYEPRWEWTDDYPFISMTFQTPRGEIEVYTSSQGEWHTPWGARVDGKAYTINSEIPMQAYNLLMPYLERDVLGEMIDNYQP